MPHGSVREGRGPAVRRDVAQRALVVFEAETWRSVPYTKNGRRLVAARPVAMLNTRTRLEHSYSYIL